MAEIDPGSAVREHYARRLALIDRWLSARRRDGIWTVADTELLGAAVLLARALLAESGSVQRVRWPLWRAR